MQKTFALGNSISAFRRGRGRQGDGNGLFCIGTAVINALQSQFHGFARFIILHHILQLGYICNTSAVKSGDDVPAP